MRRAMMARTQRIIEERVRNEMQPAPHAFGRVDALEDGPALSAVRTPNAARVLARVLMALAVVFVAALIFAPWQQTASGEGRVVAFAPDDREQAITAPVDGRVTKWHVIEGSHVKAGDIIAEMVDIDPDIMERLQRERQAVHQNLEAAGERAAAYERKRESLIESRRVSLEAARLKVEVAKQKVAADQQKIEAAEAQRVASELNLNRQRKLSQEGLASQRDVELAEFSFSKAAADVEQARADLLASRANALASEADYLKTGAEALAKIDSAEAEVKKARSDEAYARSEEAKLDTRIARQASQTVRAPRDGTILRILLREGGELVKATAPMAMFVPDAPTRAVELWVDGNDTPLISQGSRVRLQFEGWPAVQFTGWPSVAVGTFGGKVAFVDPTDNGEGAFRTLIIPDESDEAWPTGEFLRQGARAKGWVFLNEVSLGFELWRQFNGFPPSVDPKKLGEAMGKGPVGDKAKK